MLFSRLLDVEILVIVSLVLVVMFGVSDLIGLVKLRIIFILMFVVWLFVNVVLVISVEVVDVRSSFFIFRFFYWIMLNFISSVVLGDLKGK